MCTVNNLSFDTLETSEVGTFREPLLRASCHARVSCSMAVCLYFHPSSSVTILSFFIPNKFDFHFIGTISKKKKKKDIQLVHMTLLKSLTETFLKVTCTSISSFNAYRQPWELESLLCHFKDIIALLRHNFLFYRKWPHRKRGLDFFSWVLRGSF